MAQHHWTWRRVAAHVPWCMVLWMRPVLLLLPVIMCLDSIAQTALDTSALARNTLYASILGNGLYYAVSIDQRWRTKNGRHMSCSVGLTYVPGDPDVRLTPKFSLPIQWNWFRGISHHREHGAGLTFGSGWYAGSGTGDGPLASQGIYIFAKPIGYRYQRATGGFFLRVNILTLARLIELNQRYVEKYGYWETPPIIPWLGVDVGYTFRPRSKSEMQ